MLLQKHAHTIIQNIEADRVWEVESGVTASVYTETQLGVSLRFAGRLYFHGLLGNMKLSDCLQPAYSFNMHHCQLLALLMTRYKAHIYPGLQKGVPPSKAQ